MRTVCPRLAPASIFLGIAFFLLAGTAGSQSRTDLSDLPSDWSRDAIENLVGEGIMRSYPDGTFRPDRSVTRAEFAQMAVAAFGLTPGGETSFADVRGHWAERELAALEAAGALAGPPGQALQPDGPLTRAEAAEIVIGLLGLPELAASQALPDPGFTDLDPAHPAWGAVRAGRLLGLLPPAWQATFEPARQVNRAEVAYLLDATRRVEVHSGRLGQVTPPGENGVGTLVLELDRGPRSFPLPSRASVERNGRPALPETLQPGDELTLVADRWGRPAWLRAQAATRWQEQLTLWTRELLTPEQVSALAAGDWEAAIAALKASLYNQLLEQGLRPQEATALLDQDWAALEEALRYRVADQVANRLGFHPELVRAIFDEDWEKARSQAQVQALELLLGEVLAAPAGEGAGEGTVPSEPPPAEGAAGAGPPAGAGPAGR